MKNLFRKNKQVPEPQGTARKNNSLEERIARKLENATRGWSRTRLIFLFGIFTIVFGTACTVLVIKGITGSVQARFVMERLKKLPAILDPNDSRQDFKDDLLELLNYRKYLDSISNDPRSGSLYKDFLKEHPRLRDSLEQAILKYSENIKQK